MIRTCALIAAVCGWLTVVEASAQEQPTDDAASSADEAVHEELRALRRELTEAVIKGDVDGQIGHVHENVVATWQDNRVVRGRDGLRKFLAEMTAGNEKVFQGYTVPPEVDELTILHGGDTGIAFGRSVPHYKYMGMEFDLANRWTATLVKDDGGWKIAAYHVSANILDNPVLSIAKKSVYWTAAVCLVLGTVLGSVATALIRRLRRQKGAS